MNQTRKSIILCVSSILLLIIVGALYAYCFLQIKHENEYTSGLSKQLLTESQKQDDDRRLAIAIKETDEGRTKLNSYFVTGDGSVHFLGIIEGYSDVAGTQAKFTTVDYDTAKNKLIMSLRITGTFQDVYQNILMLENAPYELEFNRIIFSKDGGQAVDATKKTPTVPTWNVDINFALKSVSLTK